MENTLVDLGAAATAASPEKCTKQPVQTADRNAKFLSCQKQTGQYIAESATKKNTKNSKTKTSGDNLRLQRGALFLIKLLFI